MSPEQTLCDGCATRRRSVSQLRRAAGAPLVARVLFKETRRAIYRFGCKFILNNQRRRRHNPEGELKGACDACRGYRCWLRWRGAAGVWLRSSEGFERAKAGLEHFDRRDEWADLALKTFREGADARVPPAVAQILDPDLIHRVIARANMGNATYWVIDQFTDSGGQVLVKQENGQNPVILATDTTIFPLQAGLVPPLIADQLSASFDGATPQRPPIQVPLPASGAEVGARIFAKAKECDETLVTRDAPNTNHGRLACAFAVNEVVRRAIGKPVGGGNSTADMGEVLAKTQTQLPEQQIGPGTIIISPTHAGNVGHVGIVGEVNNPVNVTVIYSNSSARGVFSHTFTLGKWKAFYRDRKGLPVFFYALKL